MQDADKKDLQCDPTILDVFDNEEQAKLAYNRLELYRNNNPFPHIVLDNFIQLSIANVISIEYPKVGDNSNFKYHNSDSALISLGDFFLPMFSCKNKQ